MIHESLRDLKLGHQNNKDKLIGTKTAYNCKKTDFKRRRYKNIKSYDLC